jgi:L-iditol 2-dehydrogenase
MTAVGLCGTDLHSYRDTGVGRDRIVEPLVLGHEMGGVVASGPRAGERVAFEPAIACGSCSICLAGHGNLCRDNHFAGHAPTDGGLRTFMTWPGSLVLPVPDVIDEDEVALLEPLGVALHAVDLAHARAGMSAGVYGCGPIGLVLIRVLRAIGVGPILATDVLGHRIEAAGASGADEVRPATADGQPEDVDDWGPVDVAFEVAGEDASLETALRTVRVGGRVVVLGIPEDDRHSYTARTAREKGVTIVMSRRMQPRHLLRAIELAGHGIVDLSGLISHRYPLSDGPAAFDTLARRAGLKVLVKPSA